MEKFGEISDRAAHAINLVAVYETHAAICRWCLVNHFETLTVMEIQVTSKNIAEATANILTQPGHENRAYDITGPESISYFDVAATLSEVLGRTVTYVPVPEEAAKAAMLETGMPEWDAQALAEIQALFATGTYAEVTPDLEQLLGRRPRSFADFARDYANVFS